MPIGAIVALCVSIFSSFVLGVIVGTEITKNYVLMRCNSGRLKINHRVFIIKEEDGM